MKELKILVAGLSNAGKTSILRVLDHNLEAIPLLEPTPGVEYNKYEVLGLNVTAWDLGGQVLYREKYLADYEMYFGDAFVLFYVIDVQEEATFDESVQYLKDIMQVFSKMKLNDVYIVVLLHKYDLHLHTPERTAKISPLKEKITKLLADIPSTFFESSIYDPYSVFHAISEGILFKVTGRELLHRKIKLFAESFNSHAALMINSKGYVYGAWHSKSVQILELAKFNKNVFNSTGILLGTAEGWIHLTSSDQYHHLMLVFGYKEQTVLFNLLVPKMYDIQHLKRNLQKRRDNLPKFVNLLEI